MLQGRFVSIPETDCTNVNGTENREIRYYKVHSSL